MAELQEGNTARYVYGPEDVDQNLKDMSLPGALPPGGDVYEPGSSEEMLALVKKHRPVSGGIDD